MTSIFAISPKASSNESYKNTIEALDKKKMNVMEITAATAGASAILAVIPSDATTPIASQVAKLSTYLLIVIATIFFEKILLTLTGYVTFTFLIPIACALAVIYLFSNNVSDLIKKGEKTLSNFIDAIAILLITSCVIPILVLVFFVWIVKMIFGVNIQYPKLNKMKYDNEKCKNIEK